MSSGLECEFIGVYGLRQSGKTDWFYLLQNYNCPKVCWDWREENPFVGGPFPTEDAANNHLRRNHSNPGGSGTVEMSAAAVMKSKVLRELVEKAIKAEIVPLKPGPEPEQVAMPLLTFGNVDLGPGTSQIYRVSRAETFAAEARFSATRGWGERETVKLELRVSAIRTDAGISVEIEHLGGNADLIRHIETTLGRNAAEMYPGEPMTIEIAGPAAEAEDLPGPG